MNPVRRARTSRACFGELESREMSGGHLSPRGVGGKGGARRRRQASRVECGDDDLEQRDQAAARRRPRDCTDSCEGECGDVVSKRGASQWGKHGASVGKVLDSKPAGAKERMERRHKPRLASAIFYGTMMALVILGAFDACFAEGGADHLGAEASEERAKSHLGIKKDLDKLLKAPLIHLADATNGCKKRVFYEACMPALFGQGCTRFPVTGPCESEFCPRNCTGHGNCDISDLTASCSCEAGFTGHFCATQLCPEDCSGHGRCHALDGSCDCDTGYGGVACSHILCPDNCTHPNGECDLRTGICSCQTGYSGMDCSHEPKKLYNESWGVVFALALVGVCTIFIYMINLSSLRFLPDSISAIIIGAAIGLLVRIMGVHKGHFIVIRANSIFLFFLPMIMFEAGYCLKKVSFFANISTILVFAIFGTIISAMVCGLGFYYLGELGWVYKLSFLNSIVFGALLASTDPVATLAIFQALKVDATLYMLAFGESVFNDAVAIVLFESILSHYYINQEHHSFAHFPVQFVITFVVSIIIGAGSALFAALTFKHLKLDELSTTAIEISLMLVFSYMPYLLAASLRMSGIMSIFVAGIIMSHYTQWNLSDEARTVTSSMFRTLAFAAETFLFAYIGLSAVTVDYSNSISLAMWGLLLVMIGRAVNIFPLALVVNQFRTNKISLKLQFVLWFSGLRGIISFALALNVPGADHDVISAATLIIVIATIVIFGGGTIPTLRAMNMIDEDDKVFISKTAQEQQERASLIRSDSDLHPDYEATHKATPRPAAQNWFERLDQKVLLPFFRSPHSNGPATIPEEDGEH